jgi:hypothetical protein
MSNASSNQYFGISTVEIILTYLVIQVQLLHFWREIQTATVLLLPIHKVEYQDSLEICVIAHTTCLCSSSFQAYQHKQVQPGANIQS